MSEETESMRMSLLDLLSQVEQIRDQLRRQQLLIDVNRRRFNFRLFIAEQGASGKQFDEQAIVSGAFQDADATYGRRCTSDSDTSALIELTGNRFAVLEMDDANGGSPCTRFVKIAGGNLFALQLIVVGGTSGDDNEEPSWVYNATYLVGGNSFGTNLSPLWGRSIGQYYPATKGIGLFAADGTPTLLVCDEVPAMAVCDAPLSSTLAESLGAPAGQKHDDLEEAEELV